MAKTTEKERETTTEAGTISRFSKRGEETVNRLLDELGKNERVTDALARAMAAKGKLDDSARRALGQVGVAPADELNELRRQVERLEKRLARLESAAKPARKAPTRKATSGAKRAKATDATPSPAPGRAVGGGTARGSG
jgi:polyhydroxyalkanoate synthesis regulator phasin